MIRTRDFAKIKFSRSTESLVSSGKKNEAGVDVDEDAIAQDVDIISLSSAEEKPVVLPKTEPKLRKKRERKPKTATTSVRKVRKWTTPLKANYSKITDFFQKTKNEGTVKKSGIIATTESDTESGVAPLYDSDVEIIEEVPSTSATAVAAETAQRNETTPSTSVAAETAQQNEKNPSTSATAVAAAETVQRSESATEMLNKPNPNPVVKLKKLKVRVERMDMTPYTNGEVVPMNTRKRRITSDQCKLDSFVDVKPPNNCGYFDTYQRSTLPLPDNSMVRIENVELARHKFKDEPMDIDDVAEASAEPTVANIVSSPKHIAGNDENDRNVENTASAIMDDDNLRIVEATESGPQRVCVEVNASRRTSISGQSSLLVEEILSAGPSISAYSDESSKNVDVNQNHTEKPSTSRKAKQKALDLGKKPKKKKKTVTIPSYKIIEGTKLAVDAFRYGDIEGVQHYFLSHFHADHYIGLKKSFNHDIYLSEITGRLVHTFIKVDQKYMHHMALQTPIVVENVEVTALDANHCPGAVMFLFKLTTGKCILHTGDFRASPDMEEYPEFWNNTIDCIYLDTTYLSKKYAFQSQIASIAEVKSECTTFLAKNTAVGKERCLIVCGAYKIGKEKVWMSIADEFNFKVYIDKERRKAMECLDDANVLSKLTPNPNKANIHVLPLGNLNYQQMAQYLNYYNDTFSVLLAVRPSGWENRATKPKYTSNVTLLGIQYSEHSSYNELERFVKYLRPKEVISTVPMDHGNLEKTTKVPASWTNQNAVKPNRESHQPTIADMFRRNPQTTGTHTIASVMGSSKEEGLVLSKDEDIDPVPPNDMDMEATSAGNKDSNLPASNTTVHDISSDTDYMP